MARTIEVPNRCLQLKGARERLCRVQSMLTNDTERAWLQIALDYIDQVGVLECPHWSKFDAPTVEADA